MEACLSSSSCSYGYTCANNNKCYRIHTGLCYYDSTCSYGYYCASNSRCYLNKGYSCYNNNNCARGYYCSSGYCKYGSSYNTVTYKTP